MGERIAPLAILNTDNRNYGSAWVDGLAPAEKWLRVALSGRHFGNILRAPVPSKTFFGPDSSELYEAHVQLEFMRSYLEKTEVLLSDMKAISSICAAEMDGVPRVFLCTRRGEHGLRLWLWEGKGESRRSNRERGTED